MSAPEKLYLRKDFNVYSNQIEGAVEYVRSDIAEQMAKDFAYFEDNTLRYCVEDDFAKFLTSQKV